MTVLKRMMKSRRLCRRKARKIMTAFNKNRKFDRKILDYRLSKYMGDTFLYNYEVTHLSWVFNCIRPKYNEG